MNIPKQDVDVLLLDYLIIMMVIISCKKNFKNLANFTCMRTKNSYPDFRQDNSEVN